MSFRFGFTLTLAALMLLSVPAATRADVHPAALFSSNMVLQRGGPVPVWGTADPMEKVTVSLGTQSASAVADALGKWNVHLPPLPAGGPYTLTITGKNTVTAQNVLVGDVWLCSGQSNMQYAMQWHREYYAADIAASADPKLRSFTVSNNTAERPVSTLLPAQYDQQHWVAATPDTTPAFTAVGYFFARELRKQLKVPIGIIHSSWGGTNGESWVSRAALNADPELKTMADTQIQAMQSFDADRKQYPTLVAQWENKYGAKDAGNIGEAQGWAKPDFSDADWKTATVPVNFGQLGMKAGGSVWLRKTLNIPADAAGTFTWNLGGSSASVTGYCNGVKLDTSPSAEASPFASGPHSFVVPAGVIHAGANVFAVRVFSLAQDDNVAPETAKMGLPLADFGSDADTWHYKVERENAALPAEAWSTLPKPPSAQPQNTASYIYNAQIAPLEPFAIKGVLWYQGESNVGRAAQYRKILPTLIADWRARWHAPRLPFYIVQLANFGSNPPQPGNSGWAELREAQLLTAQHVAGTGLAVTVDIGESGDIHPKNKQDVGRRLAWIALAKSYGKAVPYSGPLFSGITVTGNTATLSFTHADGGLVAKGGPLKHFAVAGADGQFVWGDAKIVGQTVVVSSPQVAHPVAVRYAWADSPDGANLTNAAGLPASPFRTDTDVARSAP